MPLKQADTSSSPAVPLAAREITIALAGNPNSGKTSIFNAITGARQHVGNWPGVTVERKEGTVSHHGRRVHVVDLPGTYSLTTYSAEEIVARNYIVQDRPDVVVNIVDSSNLDRNLYLTTQLLELGVPVVIALNMWDMAQAAEIAIDDALLGTLLGVPVVRTVGSKGKGIGDLLDAAVALADRGAAAVADQRRADYGSELEVHVEELSEAMLLKFLLEPSEPLKAAMPHRRFLACKLLEGEEEAIRQLRQVYQEAHRQRQQRGDADPTEIEGFDALLQRAAGLKRHVEATAGRAAEILLADRRYGFINGALAEVVRRPVAPGRSPSDRIDAVLTHRYLGLPIFAVMMFVVFQLVFALGSPLVDVLDAGKEHLAAALRSTLAERSPLLCSLLADGIVEGVGAVLSFVPLIMLLYLAIAVLEDSGYMSRAAFVLDRLMHRIGLHGKSFIPMLIGFGCTVPAIMSTRILETRRDRLTTMLVLPLMSCGARLPVYVLLLAAFFPKQAILSAGPLEVTNQALLMLMIYAVGIVLAIVCIKILRLTLFRGEATAFVMELPPYRLPTPRGLIIHMWERGWQYVRKAGTIILAIVIILWAAKTWPALPAEQMQGFEHQRAAAAAQQADAGKLAPEQLQEQLAVIDNDEHQAQLAHSTIGRLGHAIEPALRPAGFDWKIGTAMLGAFAAKEVFVGQMGVIYSVGADSDEESIGLREKLAHDYTPLQGLSLLMFVLIASPCLATVAVTARESGHWKWALLQYGYLTILGWLVATLVYQTGVALGMG